MYDIRVLNEQDMKQLESLIDIVEENLQNELFWLPISVESRKHFADKDWSIFIGVFESDMLIGATALFLNENEFGESKDILGIYDKKIAEIGRAMVAPMHRNKGIMKMLSQAIVKIARENHVQLLLATVHPDNIPSQKALESIGMKAVTKYTKYNKYDRYIYVLDI